MTQPAKLRLVTEDDLVAIAPLASPALSGTPTAPTPVPGDNDTSVATTEFVQNVVGGVDITDTFQRADNNTSIGYSSSGSPWLTYGGTWGVNSSQAYLVVGAGASSYSDAVIDAGTANVSVEVSLPVVDAGNVDGIVFRSSDASNGFRARGDALYRMIAGAETLIGTYSAGFVATDRMRVVANGSTISVLKSTLGGSYTLVLQVTDTNFTTNTKHGITAYGTPTSARWDDFSIVRNKISVEAATRDANDQILVAKTIIDAKGDILVGTFNDTVARLPVGADGQYLIADSTQATGLRWNSIGTGIPASTVDAKGDLLVGTANDTVGRLAVGVNGSRLVSDSTQPGSMRWSTTLFTEGTGSPEGVVTAPVGSIYQRTDGSVGTVLYTKQSGAGNTGWAAMFANQPYATLTATAGTTLGATTTWTKINLATTTHLDSASFSVSASVITVLADGLYDMSGSVATNLTTGTGAIAGFGISGNTNIAGQQGLTGSASITTYYGTPMVHNFALGAGQTVALYLYHASSGTPTTLNTTGLTARLVVRRVG